MMRRIVVLATAALVLSPGWAPAEFGDEVGLVDGVLGGIQVLYSSFPTGDVAAFEQTLAEDVLPLLDASSPDAVTEVATAVRFVKGFDRQLRRAGFPWVFFEGEVGQYLFRFRVLLDLEADDLEARSAGTPGEAKAAKTIAYLRDVALPAYLAEPSPVKGVKILFKAQKKAAAAFAKSGLEFDPCVAFRTALEGSSEGPFSATVAFGGACGSPTFRAPAAKIAALESAPGVFLVEGLFPPVGTMQGDLAVAVRIPGGEALPDLGPGSYDVVAAGFTVTEVRNGLVQSPFHYVAGYLSQVAPTLGTATFSSLSFDGSSVPYDTTGDGVPDTQVTWGHGTGTFTATLTSLVEPGDDAFAIAGLPSPSGSTPVAVTGGFTIP